MSEPALTAAALLAQLGYREDGIVAGRTFAMSAARVLAFSGGSFDDPGWPHRNLHTDMGKAKEAGLDNVIASGTQSEGLLLTLLVATFGAAWHRRGHLEVRFVRPVRVDDTVRPMLQWTSADIRGDAVQFSVKCWCEDGAGERVVDGIARCMLFTGS